MIPEDNIIPELQPEKEYWKSSAPNIKYQRYMGMQNYDNSRKWYRLKQLDKQLDREGRIGEMMLYYINQLLSYFDINKKIKDYIQNDVEAKKPQKLKDVILYTFQCIIRENYPITTSEFRKVIKQEFRVSETTLKKLLPKIPRDYTWFINRVLSTINTPSKYYHKIYMKVKENFDRLYTVIGGSPCALISTLCYFSYKELNLGKIPDYKLFLSSGNTYKLHREKFKELGISVDKENTTPKYKKYKEIIKNKNHKYYQKNKGGKKNVKSE